MKKTDPSCSSETTLQSVEDFLAKGGNITSVDPGATGEDDSNFSWNQSRYPLQKKQDKRTLINQPKGFSG